MTRRYLIAVLAGATFASACAKPEVETPDSGAPDARVDVNVDVGQDVPGDDSDVDVGPDREDMSSEGNLPEEVSCDEYSDRVSCLAHLECSFNRLDGCFEEPAVPERPIDFSINGAFSFVEQGSTQPFLAADGLQLGLVISGVTRWSDDRKDGIIAGEDEGEAVTIDLYQDGTPTHRLRGWIESHRVVLDEVGPHPDADQPVSSGEVPWVMIPNDGWKPTSDGGSRPGTGRFEGRVTRPGLQETCRLEVVDGAESAEISSMDCDDTVVSPVGLATDENLPLFWFAVDVDGERRVWVGEYERENMFGIIAEDVSLWDGGTPPRVGDIDPSLVRGHFELYKAR